MDVSGQFLFSFWMLLSWFIVLLTIQQYVNFLLITNIQEWGYKNP